MSESDAYVLVRAAYLLQSATYLLVRAAYLLQSAA